MNDDKNMTNSTHDNVTSSEKPEGASINQRTQDVNTESESSSNPQSDTSPEQNDRRGDSVSARALPSDANVLVRWQLLEETEAYSRDKVIFTVLVGAAAAVFAVIAETYVFAALLLFATAFFVYVGRQGPRTLSFAVTDIGVFLENDFLSLEEIQGFNIIDDPGVRARLILRINKIIDVNEIVPIYDVNIQEIERAMEELNIERNEELEPNIFDKIAQII